MNYYTYTHTRLDTGAVFYVRAGAGGRAFTTNMRSQAWRSNAAHGWRADIVEMFDTKDEALAHETLLIISLLPSGTLCNVHGKGAAKTAARDAKYRAELQALHARVRAWMASRAAAG